MTLLCASMFAFSIRAADVMDLLDVLTIDSSDFPWKVRSLAVQVPRIVAINEYQCSYPLLFVNNLSCGAGSRFKQSYRSPVKTKR